MNSIKLLKLKSADVVGSLNSLKGMVRSGTWKYEYSRISTKINNEFSILFNAYAEFCKFYDEGCFKMLILTPQSEVIY